MKDTALKFVQRTVNSLRKDKQRMEEGKLVSESYASGMADSYARTVEALSVWEEVLRMCTRTPPECPTVYRRSEADAFCSDAKALDFIQFDNPNGIKVTE